MWILLFVLSFILVYAIFILWTERKIAAFVQDRIGPNVVGFKGLGQSFADLIKLFQKEDIIPVSSDRFMFKAAPIVIFTAVFAGFSCLPLSIDTIGANTPLGLFFLLTIVSLDVIGILMAGWGSGSKYPLFGAMRAVSQIVSYEIPLTLSVLCVVIVSHSLNLQEITLQQGTLMAASNTPSYLFGLKFTGIEVQQVGGFLMWNIFRFPVLFFAFIVFMIAALAECNRAPFDIPEAESELVAGFHTEYTGFRFAILFLGEYAMMLLMCMLAAVLFLGGWNTALPNIGDIKLADWTTPSANTFGGIALGFFWLFIKTAFLLFIQIMVRWTYPRLRVDQLMYFCWKILIPFALILVFASAFWVLGVI